MLGFAVGLGSLTLLLAINFVQDSLQKRRWRKRNEDLFAAQRSSAAAWNAPQQAMAAAQAGSGSPSSQPGLTPLNAQQPVAPAATQPQPTTAGPALLNQVDPHVRGHSDPPNIARPL